MSVFELYLRLGIEHIADFTGYDHIIFVLALSVVYSFKQWKKLLILITAFTIGHSLTLVLATLKIVKIPTDLIEFLIPVTIVFTSLGNMFQKSDKIAHGAHRFRYAMALFFGLIHGLGFSNYLRALLSEVESMLVPLLAFNIGIEIGQLIIVLVILGLAIFAVDLAGMKRREWILILSGGTLGISLIMAIERFPW